MVKTRVLGQTVIKIETLALPILITSMIISIPWDNWEAPVMDPLLRQLLQNLFHLSVAKAAATTQRLQVRRAQCLWIRPGSSQLTRISWLIRNCPRCATSKTVRQPRTTTRDSQWAPMMPSRFLVLTFGTSKKERSLNIRRFTSSQSKRGKKQRTTGWTQIRQELNQIWASSMTRQITDLIPNAMSTSLEPTSTSLTAGKLLRSSVKVLSALFWNAMITKSVNTLPWRFWKIRNAYINRDWLRRSSSGI